MLPTRPTPPAYPHVRFTPAVAWAAGVALFMLGAGGCTRSAGVPLTESRGPDRSAARGAGGAAGTAPVFTDVAEEAGVRYRWTNPGKPPFNILQTIGNGCAFLDYDDDGSLDILLVGPKPALFKGDGKGRFADVTKSTGLASLSGHFLGCAVGDYDNDGFPDVYISAYRGGVLLRNQGGKRFTDVTRSVGIAPQPWGTSCAWADVNNDGRLDLYVSNYVRFGPKTDPQLCESGGRMTSCGPRFYQPERGVLYLSEGTGFRDVTRAWGAHEVQGKALGVAFADYDGSGRQSLAIANDEVPGDLLQNNRGSFRNVGVTSGTAHDSRGEVHGGMGIDWGDYDNDGRIDLFVATFRNEAKCVYRNEDGFFAERSAALGLAPAHPYVAFGSKWLDFDNDGWLDLLIANGHVQDNISQIDKNITYEQPTQLFRNTGGTFFEDASARLAPNARRPIVGRGLATGDYDNDGRVDAVIVDDRGAPLLLQNRSAAPERHWLSLKLVGTKSNRDGVGAVVTAETGGLKQTRRCGTDGSYLSASDRRVHIGLGAATSAATVTVRWPSGLVSVLRDVPAGRVVLVKENK